jgi:hypothetical protein
LDSASADISLPTADAASALTAASDGGEPDSTAAAGMATSTDAADAQIAASKGASANTTPPPTRVFESFYLFTLPPAGRAVPVLKLQHPPPPDGRSEKQQRNDAHELETLARLCFPYGEKSAAALSPQEFTFYFLGGGLYGFCKQVCCSPLLFSFLFSFSLHSRCPRSFVMRHCPHRHTAN